MCPTSSTVAPAYWHLMSMGREGERRLDYRIEGDMRNIYHPIPRIVVLKCQDRTSTTGDERGPSGSKKGGQKRYYKDTLTKSLKQLQINPVTWEDLVQDRPAWRRSVKTGVAIYEAKRIATAKTKRPARRSQAPPINKANAQALPRSPRCQRTFLARLGLVGHL
ncbi:unnamed protein product [Schistocephalus solidus]|uniref:Uncharacterized protein n=1 Tax=Schistocephalus solidus TaxID=70667 RepID=A0A183TCS1_SCHSO|nr:unnamed protein product [Schistocephalus solidus]